MHLTTIPRVTAESVIRRTPRLAKAAALCLAFVATAASRGEDGITNIISGSTITNIGTYNVGSNGSFNALVLTNAGVLRVTGDGVLGNSSISSNNYAIVTGVGSVWSNSGGLDVGVNGSFNQLTITNGAKVFSAGSYIGSNDYANWNTVIVSGAGSVWSNASVLSAGYFGMGNQLTINDGGAVYSSDAYVGRKNHYNQAVVSGAQSVWNIATNLSVGQWAISTSLIITNGGAVYDANGTIAGGGGFQNAAVVSGSGSIWSNSYSLTVGGEGYQNQLTVSNSGKVYSTTGYIGYTDSSRNNTVLVTGVSSVWTNSGVLFVGYSGRFNRLTVSSGAKVYSTTGYVGCDGRESFNFCWDYNTGVVTGIGSLWNNSGVLYIGATSACNNLTISDAGVVMSAEAYIGYDRPGHDNSVLVTGSNSIWRNSGDIHVGYRGHDNQLTISGGGSVVNANGYVGHNAAYANPDYTPDAINSRVTVAGIGSVWSNTGSVFLGVGSTNNSLTITNGGLVVSQSGIAGISTNGNLNTALVSGSGSLWTNSGDLYLGVTGSFNQLTISNAGVVANAHAIIGSDSLSQTNSAVVTGAGSLWQNNGSLIVGSNGSASRVTVTAGGTVTASNAVVGATTLSSGNSVTVSGGNLYATNAAGNGSLDVRRGTLALNSGTVMVNQLYLTNNASSVMNFSAGVLKTGGSTVSNTVTFLVGDGVQSATLDLLGGTHRFADGLSISTNGHLIGNGDIIGSVTNFSIIAPGHSVGALSITGDLALMSSSELDFELAGSGTNDHLDISGLLAIGGGLKLTLTDGYTGNAGDTFDLFNFGSTTGTFSQTNLPALGPGMAWNTDRLYTLGEIQIIPEPGACSLLALGLAALARRHRSPRLRRGA
jgi:T5SS/PEP-CTERM-associated repeat protein